MNVSLAYTSYCRNGREISPCNTDYTKANEFMYHMHDMDVTCDVVVSRSGKKKKRIMKVAEIYMGATAS